VHVLSGVTAAEPDRARCERTWVDNIRYAADLAAGDGITLTIESLNSRDAPGYFVAHQFDALALIARLERPNVKLQLDYYHAQIMDGDLTRLTERLGGAIAHVQIASVPDRHEPDEGEIDYPHLFATLDRIGYDGWVSCEYNPRGRTEDGLGWLRPYLVR
jgi:2-dehydrotetronate isomerase